MFLTQINSKYYDIKQYTSLKFDPPSNIASSKAHIDDLYTLLDRFNFGVIGASDHNIRNGMITSNNIDISLIYVEDNLDIYKIKGLQINSSGNYESIFIEMIFPNRICLKGCL